MINRKDGTINYYVDEKSLSFVAHSQKIRLYDIHMRKPIVIGAIMDNKNFVMSSSVANKFSFDFMELINLVAYIKKVTGK